MVLFSQFLLRTGRNPRRRELILLLLAVAHLVATNAGILNQFFLTASPTQANSAASLALTGAIIAGFRSRSAHWRMAVLLLVWQASEHCSCCTSLPRDIPYLFIPVDPLRQRS